VDRTQIAAICGVAWALVAILWFAPRIRTRTEAAVQATLVILAYAAGLGLSTSSGDTEFLNWVVFAVALLIGAVLVGTLRARHGRLIAELQSVTRADPLTGLLDHRGFDEAMANELERARRSGHRFGLVVGAIDGFDQVPPRERKPLLAKVGASIGRTKRDIDSAARLEDDEFALVATYTDERGAAVLAERARANLAEDLEGSVTMSLGVVSHPRHGTTAETLIRAAREARAEAVRLGGDRNLVAISTANSIESRVEGADVSIVTVT
jgi:diguanylate cyclase (GGDEF)-like protein